MAGYNSNMLHTAKRTRVERILEPFGARHASGLIAFFNKIADADFDVVMFMARKSLCIYRMMELCGVKKITVPIASDAMLDTDASNFANKRILVVDDTLFVGTTLSDAKERLEACNPSQLQFWVYCADGDTWSTDTFKPDHIHCIVSAQEIVEFCAAECRAMINAGIPYLTDFAASRRMRMTPTQLDWAIKPVNWIFHDVSSQYHEKSKVKYYSAFPDNYINETVRTIIGSTIFEFIELAKIRVFATWSGRFYEVTFVPVITFSPTDRRSIRRAVKSICETFGINHKIFSPTHIMEKMRFLQYIIGAIFMRTYWNSLDKIIPIAPDIKFSSNWCSTVFPEEQADNISNTIALIYDSEKPIPKIKQDPPKLTRSEPPEITKETTDDIQNFLDDYFSGDGDIDFGHTPLSDLTAIFIEFQKRFETAARREISEKNPTPKYRNRLKRGIAWQALCAYLLRKYSRPNSRDSRNILSLVLDRLIDFGIAVPIIAISRDNVYRAYRHGEDVKFGAQEESLVYNLLRGFQAARGSEGIEATYLEKLIVILLRVGMNEEWLNLWYSNSGRDTLVRVGYHLQGAVPISPRREDELVPEGESSWLSRRLLKTGTLTKAPRSNRRGYLYYLGTPPEAAHVRTDAPRTAKALGNTLGKACISDAAQRTSERPISSEDLIILTSCSNSLDTTGSVSAELKIFSEWYEKQGARILRADFLNPKHQSFYTKIEGSHGAQAVNSAQWKLKQFNAEKIKDIRGKIEALEQIDSDWIIREGYWGAIFDAFQRPIEKNMEQKFARIRNTTADILVCANFLLAFLNKVSSLALTLDKSLLDDLVLYLRKSKLPPTAPLPDLRLLADKLSQPHESNVALRKNIGEVSRHIDNFGRSVCALAAEEAAAAERLIHKANLKLSRVQYAFMIWYDILDVRARRQKSPKATAAYAKSLDLFRARVNSLLSDAQERIRSGRGDLFCDTGDIGSFNDGKHIFLNLPGNSFDEGNRLVCDIVRVAESSGVQLRLLAVPTDLRGEYVYLNRGSTSIDGDFKSHVHTIIQTIEHNEAETRLNEGECIVWTLSDIASKFKNYGSVLFRKAPSTSTVEVAVNIKGFVVKNRVSYFRSLNT